MPLPVVFEDAWLIAVAKPSGMLVHRSGLAADADAPVALQTVRDQIGQPVYPLHRLDRPTSGLLVFAKDSETAAGLAEQIREGLMEKTYRAVVRGWPAAEAGTIDRPLKREYADNKAEAPDQPARTDWRCLGRVELPEANLPVQLARSGAEDRANAPDPPAPEAYRPPDHRGHPAWPGRAQPVLSRALWLRPPAAGGHPATFSSPQNGGRPDADLSVGRRYGGRDRRSGVRAGIVGGANVGNAWRDSFPAKKAAAAD
jgi:hypothetical protein